MIKLTRTYTDFNDVERTEDFFFHMTKAEVMKMEMSTGGGMAEMIQRIVAAQDIPAIMKIFEDLVLQAYGQKSPDGKRFIKTPELTEEFKQTNAYSDIFMELATDADKAAEFVNGIMPADLQKDIAKETAKAAKTK